VVFGAEAAAGVLAFALSIRLCPLPAIREELWMRLTAAGVLGDHEEVHRAVAGPGDGDGSALGRALGRTAWLATRLPYLAGSRRHRGQWISVAAEYLGRLRGPPATGSSTAGAHERRVPILPGLPSRPCTRRSGKLPRPGLGTVMGGRRCG
jgi:hypothetical protein